MPWLWELAAEFFIISGQKPRPELLHLLDWGWGKEAIAVVKGYTADGNQFATLRAGVRPQCECEDGVTRLGREREGLTETKVKEKA